MCSRVDPGTKLSSLLDFWQSALYLSCPRAEVSLSIHISDATVSCCATPDSTAAGPALIC